MKGKLLLPVILLALLQPALARSLRFSVSSSSTVTSVQVALLDQRIEGGHASLGVHYRSAPGLALHLRNTTTFGPIGNVIVDFDGAATAGNGWYASLAARATAGPVALRLRGLALDGDGQPLLREPDPSFGPTVRSHGQLVWGVQLGATYRASRELQLLFDPSLLGGGRGLALLLPLEVQLARFWNGHDLRLQVAGLLPFHSGGDLQAWTSAGLGLRINRDRAASWNAWFLLGGTTSRFSPGVSLDVQQSTGQGAVSGSLRLEPWRNDSAPLNLRLAWQGELGNMSARVWLETRAPQAEIEAGLALEMALD